MGSGNFAAVTLASFLACAVTGLGIWLISSHEKWAIRWSAYLKSFAAGMLVSLPLMHILPRSIQMHDSAPGLALAGFLALYLFDSLVRSRTGDSGARSQVAGNIAPVLAIALHSYVDGVIYSVTFDVSVLTGVLAATGMVLHEFPEGIITFSLLMEGGLGRQRSAVYAFLAAALSTPAGTLSSFPLVHRASESALGVMLALSAGALLYVGASHLLPSVQHEKAGYAALTLGAGVLVAVLITLLHA